MAKQAERFSTSLLNKMNHIDLELKGYLKRWADQQPLPAGGKAQLIKNAAAHLESGRRKTTRPASPITADMISWAMVYCVDQKLTTARIVT